MSESRRRRKPQRTGSAPAETAATVPAVAAPESHSPLGRSRLVRAGAYAWALVGLVAVAVLLVVAAGRLSIIAIPLVLALFPAALLYPASEWLKRRRLPPSLASLLTIVVFLVVLVGTFGLLTPMVAAEIPGLVDETQAGIEQLEVLFEEGLLGYEPPVTLPEALAMAQEQVVAFLQEQAVGIASVVAEAVAGLLLGLVALFFYLKDGHRIATWLRRLFPAEQQEVVHEVGVTGWVTIGQYFRGQLLVALVDAVFIGVGLAILGVPLALPLAVLVFFGGLFPIVGAFVSGAVAVLVALASQGLVIALIALGIVVAVQQLESNVLAPVVLGKATALHPLGVIVTLTAGGVLLGVLGAFLAVPVAASVTKAVGIVRNSDATPG